MDGMHRVVIVGAGFGGLAAARTLAGQPVDVTLVDQRNFHTFQPLLYEVATAGLDPGDVAYPIRPIIGRDRNVTFRYATATGVDWDTRSLLLEGEEPLLFDSLILASGVTAAFFGIPGAPELSRPLYTLSDARHLRDHILRQLEAADQGARHPDDGTLTFVVVGGGPTGVEVAGALAELLDVSVRRDGYRFDRAEGRIILVDGLDRLLTPFKEKAASYAARTLADRGVELRLGHLVKAVTPTSVELDDGTRIPTRTVVWAGGVTVDGTLASHLEAATGPNGRLIVNSNLTVDGHLDTYAVGDAAAIPLAPGSSELCPQLAQVAIQSGKHAGQQVLAGVQGRPLTPFRYHDKGIMATIGRRAAIAQFPRGQLIGGTLGWLAWLGLHLLYLIGFRNKVIVLINWAWRYLSWTSGPRVIINDAPEEPDEPGEPVTASSSGS